MKLEKQEKILDRIALIKRLNQGQLGRKSQVYQDSLRTDAQILRSRLQTHPMSGHAKQAMLRRNKELSRMLAAEMKKR